MPRPVTSAATGSLWARLRQRLGSARRPVVGLQPVGLADRDLPALQALLDDAGRQLGLRFVLGALDSEVVLLDVDYAGRTPSSVVRSLTADRPAVLVETLASGTPAAAQHRQELLRQLHLLPQVQAHLAGRPSAPPAARAASGPGAAGTASPAVPHAAAPPRPNPDAGPGPLSTVFDSSFDSVMHAEQLQGVTPDPELRALVSHLLQGLADPGTADLHAQWGADATLRVDFAARSALLDPKALQGLRVRREPPQRCTRARPGEHATEMALDELAWHLGQACGQHVLLDQPADAWHHPLLGLQAHHIERYTSQPRHLELARRLAAGPVSPSDLRRHVRINVADLRRFLQACLFLGLVRWAD